MRCLLSLIFFSIMMGAHAQHVNINVLSKMKKTYDFKTNSIIQRLVNTQKLKIDNHEMSEFEARCISTNIIDMLGSPNDERFTMITEKTLQLYPLSIPDKTFMEEIAKRYSVYMRLIANQCTIENIKLLNPEESSESAKKTDFIKAIDPSLETIIVIDGHSIDNDQPIEDRKNP